MLRLIPVTNFKRVSLPPPLPQAEVPSTLSLPALINGHRQAPTKILAPTLDTRAGHIRRTPLAKRDGVRSLEMREREKTPQKFL